MPLSVYQKTPSIGSQLLSGLGQGLYGYQQGKQQYGQNQIQKQLAQQQIKSSQIDDQYKMAQIGKLGQPDQPSITDILSAIDREYKLADFAYNAQDIPTATGHFSNAEQMSTLVRSLLGSMQQGTGIPPLSTGGIVPQSKVNLKPKPPTSEAGFTLSAGQTRYGPDGKPIVSVPKEKTTETYSPVTVSDGSNGLPAGTVYQTSSSGEIKIIPIQDGADWKSTATVLRKEFNADKVYSDFQTIQRSERQIQRAYEESLKPMEDGKSRVASDQALAVSFQKLLDPSSVVRESEYARTPEGVALMNKLNSFIPQLEQGGLMIADSDRKAIMEMASKLLVEAKRTMNDHIQRYAEIADLYSVPQKALFGNIKPFDLNENGQNMDPTAKKFLEDMGAF